MVAVSGSQCAAAPSKGATVCAERVLECLVCGIVRVGSCQVKGGMCFAPLQKAGRFIWTGQVACLGNARILCNPVPTRHRHSHARPEPFEQQVQASCKHNCTAPLRQPRHGLGVATGTYTARSCDAQRGAARRASLLRGQPPKEGGFTGSAFRSQRRQCPLSMGMGNINIIINNNNITDITAIHVATVRAALSHLPAVPGTCRHIPCTHACGLR